MKNTPKNDEIEIDLWELFFALKKRLVFIIPAILIGALVAGIYTKVFVTPMYSSTSTMLVLTKETTLTSLADLQIGSQLTEDYSMLIRSRTVLQKTIRNLDLDMTYQTLKSSITINNPADTRILEITVLHPDPEQAKAIVDELSDVGSEFIGDQMEVVPPKIIEEGEVPRYQTSPSLKKNVMMGALAGFVIAAGIVILMTILNDTIKYEEDVERYLGLPTLAVVPDRKDYISGKPSERRRKKKRRRRRNGKAKNRNERSEKE